MEKFEVRFGKLVLRAEVNEKTSAEDAAYIKECMKMWSDRTELCEKAKVKYPEIADKIDNIGLLMDDECIEPVDIDLHTEEDVRDSVYATLEEFGEDSLNYEEEERVVEIA